MRSTPLPAARDRRALAALLLCAAPAQEPATARVELLDNGDFRDVGPDFADGDGQRRIPWWRSTYGMDQVQQGADPALLTKGDAHATQPIAAFAPLARSLRIAGRVRGTGRLELRDGAGGVAAFELASEPDSWREFEVSGDDVARALGREPRPRFVLRLAGAGDGRADWSRLSASVELPLPSEEELRAELVRRLELVFDLWLERGVDLDGTVATGFVCHLFDVVTGERLSSFPGGHNPLFQQLLDAVEVEPLPRWSAALERHVAAFLEHGLQAETGLPRTWDAEKDEPIADRFLQIGAPLGFLIDLAERGPLDLRPACRSAAARIGEVVLARGVQPDGSVATRYRALDAEANADTQPIRELDVAAQLGRLGALTGEERFTHAAQRALRRLEFTHYWAGSWDYLDPGFDDHFGHIAARAVTLWKAHPRIAAFRNLAYGGLQYYAPHWRDAVRLGGYVAADQVRCWAIVRDMARLDERVRQYAPALLGPALRAHFKSEQYDDGTWGDVTYYLFDPKVQLEVGDLPAIPQNLLLGLALAYDDALGLRSDEVRAMYAAVLSATDTAYRRPYGYLGTLRERSGENPSGGSIRLANGLVEMLRALGGTR